MKLSVLRESITEGSALRIFSRLVTSVNGLSELLGKIGGEEEDLNKQLEEAGGTLTSIGERISSMGMSNSLWDSLKSSVISGQDVGNSWMEFRSLICNRMIPEILNSITQITDGNIENTEAKIAIAKERVQNLQEIITGMAPGGDVPEIPTSL